MGVVGNADLCVLWTRELGAGSYYTPAEVFVGVGQWLYFRCSSEKMALSESQMIKECSLLRMPETQRSNGGKSDNLTGFLPYSHSSVLQEAYAP